VADFAAPSEFAEWLFDLIRQAKTLLANACGNCQPKLQNLVKVSTSSAMPRMVLRESSDSIGEFRCRCFTIVKTDCARISGIAIIGTFVPISF
jgi:hypothetical protein